MATGQAEAEGIQSEHLTRQGIDMGSFLAKYLRAGEVHEPVVVVAYPHSAQQFWADVRKEEEDMGISISDGVRLDMYQGMTTLRMIELLVGVLILAWLGTMYGRLIMRRILASKQKKTGESK
ncbi:hypothetical protein TELCIR_01807 [Teladorsagia circumcincta]|uniref:Uncharacterized protein n=1 Tax=Teladorsagia circumcincta TaxID=45464 RepID=A0A2G9V326_TELCI|nr:hypothetical protein TELCIR_01807 [Teladorsagia circumcincta]